MSEFKHIKRLNPLSPADTRAIFGENIRFLCARKGQSISETCRGLQINRSQFSRYLTGESSPRTDILAKICAYFDVDARILLEPLQEIATAPTTFATMSPLIDESILPSGFYKTYRQSSQENEKIVVEMEYVFRTQGKTYVRGYLQVNATNRFIQGEFGGQVFSYGDGLVTTVTTMHSAYCWFEYRQRTVYSLGKLWLGYQAFASPEVITAQRATRKLCEAIPHNSKDILKARREVGVKSFDDVNTFISNHLRKDVAFR